MSWDTSLMEIIRIQKEHKISAAKVNQAGQKAVVVINNLNQNLMLILKMYYSNRVDAKLDNQFRITYTKFKKARKMKKKCKKNKKRAREM